MAGQLLGPRRRSSSRWYCADQKRVCCLHVRQRRSRVAGMPLAGSRVICGLMPITASGSRVNRIAAQRRRDDRCFHQGKTAPHTYPLPAAEWIIRKLWDALCEPILPAFGTKLFGLRKIPGIAVVHPLAHQHGIPPLHPVPPSSRSSVASRPITYTGGNNRMDSAITAAV